MQPQFCDARPTCELTISGDVKLSKANTIVPSKTTARASVALRCSNSIKRSQGKSRVGTRVRGNILLLCMATFAWNTAQEWH